MKTKVVIRKKKYGELLSIYNKFLWFKNHGLEEKYIRYRDMGEWGIEEEVDNEKLPRHHPLLVKYAEEVDSEHYGVKEIDSDKYIIVKRDVERINETYEEVYTPETINWIKID